MKWRAPDSIAGRTLLVLLIGLTVSHILSVALYFMDRLDALTTSGEVHVGERIATVVQLVENAPEQEGRRILEYVNSPYLQVSWSSSPRVKSDEGWNATPLRKALNDHLKKTGSRKFAIRYGEESEFGATGIEELPNDTTPIYASVQLKNGAWLNFTSFVEEPERFWSVRFTLSIVVMVTAVLILSALVVHHLTAPLRTFSEAAEQLGLDIHIPPLPESGPREVRHAARAFNEMQMRIARLIDDRTRMLAAISHDLRTPITRLRLRAEYIEDAEQNGKALRDLDEMEDMISSLLAFARDDADQEPREVVDLIALLHSVCDDLADTGSEVEFSGEGRLPYLCSRLALRRAFNNLLENAVRYGERARVTLSDCENQIVVRIDDDGPGIPDAETEKAFDPFYRIETSRNRETGGTGVGLHVARTIIRSHGGEVSLKNRTEGGLRATVRLPRNATHISRV